MKKLFLILVAILLVAPKAKADEGMWMLQLIEKLNYNKMRDMGMKLTAEEIYSINENSLKDAIMIFGGGCTGEVISPDGLLLTNHHCGYGAIQQHSTVKHDYLKDGFWAMSRAEEIATPGLSVKFIKKIVDVTDMALKNTNKAKNETERADIISKNIAKIVKKAPIKDIVGASVIVKPFFGGNQYIMFVIQEFSDVRMVGAPPSSIGKFGGDTDNWMWPRHTGDFSMFRIYADKDNNPAEFSKDNVPYKAPKHLKISLKGVKENDFSMIMGFPGSTQRYMTSYELDERMSISNAIRIYVRGVRLGLLMEDMVADPKVKIQYASKYAGSSNYWKNSIGMNQALTKLNVKADKEKIEKGFNAWAKSDPARNDEYGNALNLISKAVEGRKDESNAIMYYSETVGSSVEILSVANVVNRMITSDKFSAEKTEKYVEDFYKNYSLPTDKKVAVAMIEILLDKVNEQFIPEKFVAMIEANGGVEGFVTKLYSSSIFRSEADVMKAIKESNKEVIENDMAVAVVTIINAKRKELSKSIEKFDDMYTEGHRTFIAGLLKQNPEVAYSPDANFTIRLTYGKVLPYSPKDAVEFGYLTTLKGVIEKEDPNNTYDFTVPAKLKELYEAKDYGQYAAPGEDVVTCFISDLDITGGNSGSPTMNAKGELTGIAFDGNWEAMSGDIAFEHDMQRCIVVDIRYVLFIVDKFAGATHLIEEMDIVK